MSIKLLIFDLDGVLTETSKQHYSAWKKLSKEIGIEIDLKLNETLKGVARMDSLERILKFGRIDDKYSYQEKLELAAKKNNYYFEMIKNFSLANLFEGVEDLLERLKDRNFKIALGSASRNGPFLLKAMDIEKYFDYIVNPIKIKNGKPAPDTFLDARDKFKLNSSECVGIEDSIEGIKSIKSANMFAIGIGDPSILTEADIVYEHTRDINIDNI